MNLALSIPPTDPIIGIRERPEPEATDTQVLAVADNVILRHTTFCMPTITTTEIGAPYLMDVAQGSGARLEEGISGPGQYGAFGCCIPTNISWALAKTVLVQSVALNGDSMEPCICPSYD